MNLDEARQFLTTNSPMPNDEEISDELIDRYDEVRRFLLEHPDRSIVGPLLNSFGEGSGLGVYQLIGDVIAKCPRDAVEAELATALASPHRGVRFWSTGIAAEIPSPSLRDPLIGNLRDPDADVRAAAADAVAALQLPECALALRKAYEEERVPYVREAISRALGMTEV